MMRFAALLAALACAAGIRNCRIPTEYVAGGEACLGPAVGYQVFGVCVNFLNPDIFGVPSNNIIRRRLVVNDTGPFTAANAGTSPGCSVPNVARTWALPDSTLEAITDKQTCTPLVSPIPIQQATFKGVEIRCDTANNYFPVRGYEGTNICGPGLGHLFLPPRPNPPLDDYFFGNGFANFNATSTSQVRPEAVATFLGPNSLRCAKACKLPLNVCANGALLPNIVGDGQGVDVASCTLRPNRPGVLTTGFTFRCISAGVRSPVFRVSCSAGQFPTSGTNPILATSYSGQCGGRFGAETAPLFDFGSDLDFGGGPILQGAGEVDNFPGVTSTLDIAYPVINSAGSTFGTARDNWNDNPAQPLQDGSVYRITINTCGTSEDTETMVRCVQQTLNWWRCIRDVPFGGAVCYADGVPVACPAHELGHRCPSSSKKGLIGLLGLLALIPLILVCFLWLCFIRRKRVDPDVKVGTLPGLEPIPDPNLMMQYSAMSTMAPIPAAPPLGHAGSIPASLINPHMNLMNAMGTNSLAFNPHALPPAINLTPGEMFM